MKKLFLTLSFILVLVLPAQAFAAIIFGDRMGGGGGGSETDCSITNVSATSTNNIILFWLEYDNQGNTATVAYDDGSGGGSQSFTQLGTYQNTTNDGGTGRGSLWYLTGPTSGTGRRILCTQSASSPHQQIAVSYQGVAQTSTFTTVTQGTDTATGLADTDTSDTDGSWQISGAATVSGQPIVVASGGVMRNDRINNGSVFLDTLSDSNATVANGISNTINYTWAAAHDLIYISAMMRPVAAATINPTGQDFFIFSDE